MINLATIVSSIGYSLSHTMDYRNDYIFDLVNVTDIARNPKFIDPVATAFSKGGFHINSTRTTATTYRNQPVYVSLTTMKQRQYNAYITIVKLLTGSKLPTHIFLFISSTSHILDIGIKSKNNIHSNLLQLAVIYNKYFSIIYTNNIGPHRKLLPLIAKKWHEDCVVITVDDDTEKAQGNGNGNSNGNVIDDNKVDGDGDGDDIDNTSIKVTGKYQSKLVQHLLNYDQLSQGIDVVCMRPRRMGLCKKSPNKLVRYRRWRVAGPNRREILLLPTGTGGILYHIGPIINNFHDVIFDKNLISLTSRADDIMFRLATMSTIPNPTYITVASRNTNDYDTKMKLLDQVIGDGGQLSEREETGTGNRMGGSVGNASSNKSMNTILSMDGSMERLRMWDAYKRGESQKPERSANNNNNNNNDKDKNAKENATTSPNDASQQPKHNNNYPGVKKQFPPHWGTPPSLQKKDLRTLPGGYGLGSSTLVSWINNRMWKDQTSTDMGNALKKVFFQKKTNKNNGFLAKKKGKLENEDKAGDFEEFDDEYEDFDIDADEYSYDSDSDSDSVSVSVREDRENEDWVEAEEEQNEIDPQHLIESDSHNDQIRVGASSATLSTARITRHKKRHKRRRLERHRGNGSGIGISGKKDKKLSLFLHNRKGGNDKAWSDANLYLYKQNILNINDITDRYSVIEREGCFDEYWTKALASNSNSTNLDSGSGSDGGVNPYPPPIAGICTVINCDNKKRFTPFKGTFQPPKPKP
jgi:hypothetical protein